MEQASPLFSGALSQNNIQDIEEVQKMAFKIILRGQYRSYGNALELLEQKTLEERRQAISLKFANNNKNHPKMKHLFEFKQNLKTRSGHNTKKLNTRH